ncbi:N-acetylglucosamine/diacetylchitobiose ABC transporter substrate-binding protein [Catenuloplanes japonicus]|uniref:N-acetylglucosamine/diacetylchitobiose ABC transporter substrate-binding protein n=1 Tax=Catenuloplanes japonicus TaxID=33876 RepID=UPI000526FCBA|nr:N-acetylglucosamine/diacetylchitobiose ABC transporter substrate-binding protein [Catenuloplanes japonicus]
MSDNDLTRRTLLRRTAAAGLLATPAMGLLSACVTGGGEDEPADQAEGEKSAENPLGVDGKAPLEIVIFNGGYGEKYATDVHEPLYKAKFPEAQIKHSATQEIATTLQPRFAGGTPPDFVNNSGTKFMDFGTLIQDGQLQDLTELFAAPSVDDPAKKVSDTLVAGTIESGTYNGKPYVLNYVFTVYGLWYSEKLFKDKGWTVPATWADFTKLLDTIKAAGITPYAYAGKNAPYYQYLAILTSAAKLGGPDVLKNIDNLADGAWKAAAVKTAATQWAEIGAKYMDKSDEGLIHTEVQLKQNQGKVAFYPSGSWLEAEQAASTPEGFNYAVTPIPAADGATLATGLFATAGEPYFVSAKGTNPRGGMEYARQMLSKAGAKGFTELNKSLTSVAGAEEGITLSPGLTSASTVLKAAGTGIFSYRFDGWYKELDTELRTATNALMFGRETADQFCERMQKKADAIKADSSITKFTR